MSKTLLAVLLSSCTTLGTSTNHTPALDSGTDTAGRPPRPGPMHLERIPAPDCSVDADALADCVPGVAALADGLPYPDVGLALVSASAGAEVVVCPGRYGGGLDVTEHTLRAADPTPDATVFDGEGERRAVVTATDAVLHGITVRGGGAWENAAVDTLGEVTLRCATLTGNTGGAVSAAGPLRIHGTTLTGNTNDDGPAAISAMRGLDLQHSRIADNGAPGVGSITDIYADLGLLVADSVFEHNTSRSSALSVHDPGAASVVATRFEANVGEDTAALDLVTGRTVPTVDLTGSSFLGNQGRAAVRAAFTDGGTVLLDGTSFLDTSGAALSAVPGLWDQFPDLELEPMPTTFSGAGVTFARNAAARGAIELTEAGAFTCGGSCTFDANTPCDVWRVTGACEPAPAP